MNFKDFGDSLIQLASDFYGVEVTIGVLTPDAKHPTYAATFVTVDGYKLPSKDGRILCRGEGKTAEQAVEVLGAEFAKMVIIGTMIRDQEEEVKTNMVNRDYSLN